MRSVRSAAVSHDIPMIDFFPAGIYVDEPDFSGSPNSAASSCPNYQGQLGAWKRFYGYPETVLLMALPRFCISSPMPRTVAHPSSTKTTKSDTQRSKILLFILPPRPFRFSPQASSVILRILTQLHIRFLPVKLICSERSQKLIRQRTPSKPTSSNRRTHQPFGNSLKVAPGRTRPSWTTIDASQLNVRTASSFGRARGPLFTKVPRDCSRLREAPARHAHRQ